MIALVFGSLKDALESLQGLLGIQLTGLFFSLVQVILIGLGLLGLFLILWDIFWRGRGPPLVAKPSDREWTEELRPQLDPMLTHVHAVLFYPPPVSWEKGERTPAKNIPRFKAIVNDSTKKAYWMAEYAEDLLKRRRIQWITDTWISEEKFRKYFESKGITLIERPASERDLLETVQGRLGEAPILGSGSAAKREQQTRIHHGHLLSVYRKWIKCFISYPGRYNYGSTYFRIQIGGLPDQEDYYKEARTDLECYPETHRLLLDAEKLVEEANNRGNLIAREMEQEVKQALEKHGLEEWNEGGREAGRWYYYHTVIPVLLVQPVVERSKYLKPSLVLKDGVIRAPEMGYDLAGNLSSEEAEGPDRLIQVLHDLTTGVVPKMSNKVLGLQEDLKSAEKAYADFKDSLLREVIKPLETDFPIPSGGKCEICLSLRS